MPNSNADGEPRRCEQAATINTEEGTKVGGNAHVTAHGHCGSDESIAATNQKAAKKVKHSSKPIASTNQKPDMNGKQPLKPTVADKQKAEKKGGTPLKKTAAAD